MEGIHSNSSKKIPPSQFVVLSNPKQPSITEVKRANIKEFEHAAIVSDVEEASQIGIDIMQKLGGSATDAAIATMFVNSVYHPGRTGLGGGNILTIYDTPRGETSKIITTIFGRDVAPEASHQDMFIGNPDAAQYGALAVGVPGELAGLYAAWKKFGRVDWADLLLPSIKMCREGVCVNRVLAYVTKAMEGHIRADPNLRSIFTKADGSLVVEGDIIKQPKMAATLEKVSNSAMSFYKGSLAREIIQDLKDAGGNISLADLTNYSAKEKKPLKIDLENGEYTVYVPRLPSGGPVLLYILNILDKMKLTPTDADPSNIALTYHRMVEAFKFAYAQRTALGDEDFMDFSEIIANMTSHAYGKATAAKISDSHTNDISYYGVKFDALDDHGTSHVSVLAPDGSAVCITSSLNTAYGSGVCGERTGILFNNGMDDFSTPGMVNIYGFPSSTSNHVEPGKMPMSSMCPTLVMDKNGDVVMAIGGMGGSFIITGMAKAIVSTLWLKLSLQETLDSSKLHHQLIPNHVQVDKDMDEKIKSTLKKMGHEVCTTFTVIPFIHIIKRTESDAPKTSERKLYIQAGCDGRSVGIPAGF